MSKFRNKTKSDKTPNTHIMVFYTSPPPPKFFYRGWGM